MQYICLSIVYWCFSFWLTSLCKIGSSFIHLIRTDSNVFFLMAEQYSIVYGIHSFLTHSSADRHLGCFHALAIVNSAVMNIGAHVSFSLLSESRFEWEESLMAIRLLVVSPAHESGWRSGTQAGDGCFKPSESAQTGMWGAVLLGAISGCSVLTSNTGVSFLPFISLVSLSPFLKE